MAGADWRQGTGGKRPEPARGTSRRSWQPGAAKPEAGGRRRSRTRRLLLAGLAAGLFIALLVYVITRYQEPSYPSLIVVAPNAPKSLALTENVAGQNTATALEDWAKDQKNKDRPYLAANPSETADKEAWAAKLDRNAKSVVLYFAAHGGADEKGPYLWFVPSDAQAPADGHKLYVETILDHLRGLRKDQQKVVIFDATRVPASWPHGAIINDFARALQDRDGEIAQIDNLVVICASKEDERSWVSEEWRESVFGHFVVEGLKGAAGNPGDRITAEKLFDYVTGKVGEWAVANRDEKQTPMLLPKDKGRKKAREIELAAVPADGYQTPPNPEPPGKMPDDLRRAWEVAAELAARDKARGMPAPETAEPGKWREYLDLLVRWERLVRMGEDPGDVRKRANDLAVDLDKGPIPSEPACLVAAVPVGRALGFSTTPRNPAEAEKFAEARAADFRLLWSPKKDTPRGTGWADQSGGGRVAMADLTVADVLRRLKGEPSAKVLKTADEVLDVVDGSRVGTAEAHFLRMLRRYLDEKRRPPEDLLITAITLRRNAEETAWVGGIGPDAYPYPEQVFRWVRGHVEAGDTAREFGQDLLFDTSEPSWEAAKTKYFPEAAAHYQRARDEAKVLAAALATRDKVLSRLPYYARWVAADRRKPQADVEALLTRVEAVAQDAHAIAELANKVPTQPAERDEALKQLAARAKHADAEFAALVALFDTEVRDLKNPILPSNWFALENALSVPFIAAKDRERLFGHVRYVSYGLSQGERANSTSAPAIPAQELAKRQGRMALAVLGGGGPELGQMVLIPKQGAWWESYRDAGERIGRRFRGLTNDVKDKIREADAQPDIKAAAPHLGQAAYLTRLADPAAPVQGIDAPAGDQRYWRHYLLLWQAERSITAGWADVGNSRQPDDWYCRKSAKLFIDTARDLIGSPDDKDRRSGGIRVAEKLQPVTLTLEVGKRQRGLADEPKFPFDFTIEPRGGAVGFPVYWLSPPGPPYLADAKLDGRKVARGFADGKPLPVRNTFDTIPRAEDVLQPGTLGTTVLYRGRKDDQAVELKLAGTPTIDWRYIPPKGDSGFMVLADKELVAGTVTLLIDLTGSMREKINPNDPQSRTRLQEAKKGLELILKELPVGTTVTLATFYGEGRAIKAQPLVGPVRLERNNDARERLLNAVEGLKAPGESTPLGGAIREVLVDSKQEFWPRTFTGSRTLIVLTDGEDNWDANFNSLYGNGVYAGDVALAALKRTPDDLRLHLIFFGMGGKDAQTEQGRAYTQFEVLERPEHFRDPVRTPGRRYKDVVEARALAELVREAMLPRVEYRREATAANRQDGNIQITVAEKGRPAEGLYRPSSALSPGVYDLWNLRTLQKLRLDPGDRVLLKARRQGDGFDLFVPPFAFEVAEELNLPRNSAGDPRRGVHLTIPGWSLEPKVGHAHLNMVATIEPFGGSEPGKQLNLPKPHFAWFDVDYADNNPAEPGLRRTLRVVNRPGLLTTAWDIKVTQWDRNAGPEQTRRPAVTGVWVEGVSNPPVRYPLDLANLERVEMKPSFIRETRIEMVGTPVIEDIAPRSDEGGSSLPPGKYLTVRLHYGEKGRHVFLRPGKLKGTEQPFLLSEQHLYFDDMARYTARFGPLTPEDLRGSVELELYAVADLKDRANSKENPRAATVRFDRPLEPKNVPDSLIMEPKK